MHPMKLRTRADNKTARFPIILFNEIYNVNMEHRCQISFYIIQLQQ